MFIEKIKKINDTIAIVTVKSLSTMACVYIFTIWSLIPLFFPITRDFVFYISGGILQLSLLPAIMVGSSLLGRASEERASQDHIALMEAIDDLHKIMADESLEDESLNTIEETLTEIKNRLTAIENK